MDLSDVLVDEKKIPHTFRQLYADHEWEETVKDLYSDWSTSVIWPDLEARQATTPMPRKKAAPVELLQDKDGFPILTKFDDRKLMTAERLAPVVHDYLLTHWCMPSSTSASADVSLSYSNQSDPRLITPCLSIHQLFSCFTKHAQANCISRHRVVICQLEHDDAPSD